MVVWNMEVNLSQSMECDEVAEWLRRWTANPMGDFPRGFESHPRRSLFALPFRCHSHSFLFYIFLYYEWSNQFHLFKMQEVGISLFFSFTLKTG